jgi:hypothetical protein
MRQAIIEVLVRFGVCMKITKSNRGAALLENLLMVALVIGLGISSIRLAGQNINAISENVANEMNHSSSGYTVSSASGGLGLSGGGSSWTGSDPECRLDTTKCCYTPGEC